MGEVVVVVVGGGGGCGEGGFSGPGEEIHEGVETRKHTRKEA